MKKFLLTLFAIAMCTLSAQTKQDSLDIDAKIQEHSSNYLTVPQFSGEFFPLIPLAIPLINTDQLVVKDIDTVWDIEKFKKPRVPAKIGEVENQTDFTKLGVPRCIHLPIKLPQSDIRIPKEYQQFTEVLQKILNYEYSANYNFNNYYAYLTVDQGFVPRESSQRVPGPHVDGIPRDRENPQTVIDHAYLVTNAIPTRFYFQPFDMDKYDLNKHHFFAIFRALADETQSFTTKPFEINLMNAYSVHTPEYAECDVDRTLIRLEFSVLDFDREGNSINPAFVEDRKYSYYPFKYIPRPIPKHLTIPTDIFQFQPISSKVYADASFDQFGRARLVKQLRDSPRESTEYHYLERAIHQIELGHLNGFVVVHDHVVQGFAVFEETPDKINISMLYTHSRGSSKELMIWMLKNLKMIAGSKALVFIEDENNMDMIKYFERAANFAKISYSIERNHLIFNKIFRETKEHKEYLTKLGLEDRAKEIQVIPWEDPKLSLPIDLTVFDQRTPLPIEVVNFDPKKKNTLITLSSDTGENDPEELKKILNIRLYPSLRNLIREERLEVFLGSSSEMAAYYKERDCKILLQFKIPSSATYYLAEDSNSKKIVIMAGLVSRENLIAQLLTLKLANIPLDSIEIIGKISHFTTLAEQDISLLCNSKGSHSVLIIAGCGLRDIVNQHIYDQYSDLLAPSSNLDGNVVHLTSIPLRNPMNGISRFIVVDLVYGEIMEPIVEQILDLFSCTYVFSGSAGGFIPCDEKAPLPEIGDWIPITKSMHYSGEIVSLTSENDAKMHLQIPSIFLETYEWLEDARTKGASVDVETFYILRAIDKHNQQRPEPIQAHCGYFVSDYLGKSPLRSYIKVYAQYPNVLSSFLTQALSKKECYISL